MLLAGLVKNDADGCAMIVVAHLLQQVSEVMIFPLLVTLLKTNTSLWNMSNASAPIHITATREK